jgi:alkylhydroperoxidase family enzyme
MIMTYQLHTETTAPEASKQLLAESRKAFGMIPNLHAMLAESPAALEAYKNLHDLFQQTSFDADELTVVWQTLNVEHECHYCVAAHTAIANMLKVDPAITAALRNGTELPTSKLQALHVTTLELARERGRPSEATLNAFFAAGYQQRHVLEIILGISQKVLSNYANHIAETPIDKAFSAFAWEGKQSTAKLRSA